MNNINDNQQEELHRNDDNDVEMQTALSEDELLQVAPEEDNTSDPNSATSSSSAAGDSVTSQSPAEIEWNILSQEIKQICRAYKSQNLNRIPAVSVLQHAVADVESLRTQIRVNSSRLIADLPHEIQLTVGRERSSLSSLLQRVRDGLVSEIFNRTPTTSQRSTTSRTSLANLKLPKLEIQTFKGDRNAWITFKNQYLSAIHSNPNLNDGERFQYLDTLIEGEPQHYVSRLPRLEGNYQEAWNILLSEYDNPILILQHHVEELLSSARVQKEGCTLRQLYATFKQHLAGIRTVERENPNIDATAISYIFLFLNKCPASIKREFRKEIRRDTNFEITENGFFKFVQNLVHAEIEPNKLEKPKGKIVTALPVADGGNRFCLHCRKKTNHFLSTCPIFKGLAVEERCAIARRLRVCYNCLRKRCAVQCSKSKCTICQGRHHAILHNNNFKRKNDTEGKSNISYIDILKVLKLTSDEPTQSLLTTVILKVRNGPKVINIRALLDSGSQKSFLTDKVCQALNLSTTFSSFQLESINNLRTSVFRQAQVEIQSLTSNYTRTSNVLILKKIINHLPSTFFSIDSWRIPEAINLADPTFNIPSDIDM